MTGLPYLDLENKVNHSPHLVILGAGASRAAFPDGERSGKKLPLMNDFVESVGLVELLEEHSVMYAGRNFEGIYSELAFDGDKMALLSLIQNHVREYFSDMELPPEVTIYDKLILSLRRKDTIATFNWDPLLLKVYLRNIEVGELPQLLFLHGNTYVGLCNIDQTKGYINSMCMKCGTNLEPSRLLFPIKDKNYTNDPFIRDEWNRLFDWLRNAYFVTIFGYSAPTTDLAAKEILVDGIAQNKSKELVEIEIIDTRNVLEVEGNWKKFLDQKHYSILQSFDDSYLINHPRRTCEALAFATLQQEPWRDSPYSDTNDLLVLQGEAKMLVQEELAKRTHLSPFEDWEKGSRRDK